MCRSRGRQGLPGVNLTSGYTENVLESSHEHHRRPDRQLTAATTLTVPDVQRRRRPNSVRAAETRVDAGRLGLRGTEANLFTNVVGAYMDVIRDEAIVSLNEQNVKVLDVNLQASKDRFQVGDLTRTDVAQSDARLAVARSQLQIGAGAADLQPGKLYPAGRHAPGQSGRAAGAAQSSRRSGQRGRGRARRTIRCCSPRRRTATQAASYDIDVARANRLPRLNVNVGGNYYNYLGSLGSGTVVAVGPVRHRRPRSASA